MRLKGFFKGFWVFSPMIYRDFGVETNTKITMSDPLRFGRLVYKKARFFGICLLLNNVRTNHKSNRQHKPKKRVHLQLYSIRRYEKIPHTRGGPWWTWLTWCTCQTTTMSIIPCRYHQTNILQFYITLINLPTRAERSGRNINIVAIMPTMIVIWTRHSTSTL